MAATKGHKRTEIRLAGEGGQGMILAGIILAENHKPGQAPPLARPGYSAV